MAVVKHRKNTWEVSYQTDVGEFRGRRKEIRQLADGSYKNRWELWAPTERRWPLVANLTMAQMDKIVKLAANEPAIDWTKMREIREKVVR